MFHPLALGILIQHFNLLEGFSVFNHLITELAFGWLSDEMILSWKLKMLLANGKVLLVTTSDEKYHFGVVHKHLTFQLTKNIFHVSE